MKAALSSERLEIELTAPMDESEQRRDEAITRSRAVASSSSSGAS